MRAVALLITRQVSPLHYLTRVFNQRLCCIAEPICVYLHPRTIKHQSIGLKLMKSIVQSGMRKIPACFVEMHKSIHNLYRLVKNPGVEFAFSHTLYIIGYFSWWVGNIKGQDPWYSQEKAEDGCLGKHTFRGLKPSC